MNILLVEDNLSIIEGLEFAFKNKGYLIDSCTNMCDTISCLSKNSFDLIILDITLPDGNGFDLYQNYINEKHIPTIFLTAKDSEFDVVRGLEIGADDYVTKPFSTNELLARVAKIITRIKKKTIIKVKNITFDMDKMIVYKDDAVINLTSLEIKILNLLFLNMDKAYQETVLPSAVKTIVIEASSGLIWNRIASSPDMILSIDDFAYGGVPIEVLTKMEFDYDSLKLKVESLLN